MAKNKNPTSKRARKLKRAPDPTSPTVLRPVEFPRELWELIGKTADDLGMTKSQMIVSCIKTDAIIISDEHKRTLVRLAERRGVSSQNTVESLIDREATHIRSQGGTV